jgi:hypothetical protein
MFVWWHTHRNWFSSFIWMDKSVYFGRGDHSVGYCQPRCAHQLAAWVLVRLSPSYMLRLKTTPSILLFSYQFSSIAFLCVITLQSCCTFIFRNICLHLQGSSRWKHQIPSMYLHLFPQLCNITCQKIIIKTFITMRTLDLILYLYNKIAVLYVVSEKHFVLLI